MITFKPGEGGGDNFPQIEVAIKKIVIQMRNANNANLSRCLLEYKIDEDEFITVTPLSADPNGYFEIEFQKKYGYPSLDRFRLSTGQSEPDLFAYVIEVDTGSINNQYFKRGWELS